MDIDENVESLNLRNKLREELKKKDAVMILFLMLNDDHIEIMRNIKCGALGIVAEEAEKQYREVKEFLDSLNEKIIHKDD